MRMLCIVLLAGCTGKPIPKPAPAPIPLASSPIATALPTVTRTQADRTLHDDAPLDYERPFNNKPYPRSDITKQFQALCERGDREACIVESELVGYDKKLEYLNTVEANCRAGHLMSCRALPIDEGTTRFRDLPGAMSRLYECSKPDRPAPCAVAMLRSECEMGFPQACYNLGASDPSAVGDALLKKWFTLSSEGCRAGIAMDCRMAEITRGVNDQIAAASRLCDLHRDDCADLYYAYVAAHESTNARDAYERACQYGARAGLCLALGGKYVDGELKEPILGRGQALIDWACPKLAETKYGKNSSDYKARCTTAVAK